MVRKILTAAYADLLSLPFALEFMGVCVCVHELDSEGYLKQHSLLKGRPQVEPQSTSQTDLYPGVPFKAGIQAVMRKICPVVKCYKPLIL